MSTEFDAIRETFDRILPISEEKWQELAGLLTLKPFSAGDFLIREGQTAQHIYFLNHGATRNYFLRDGKEYTVDFVFTGDFTTGYYSLITREPSPVFIEALVPTETVVIVLDALNALYDRSHHEIGRASCRERV